MFSPCCLQYIMGMIRRTRRCMVGNGLLLCTVHRASTVNEKQKFCGGFSFLSVEWEEDLVVRASK